TSRPHISKTALEHNRVVEASLKNEDTRSFVGCGQVLPGNSVVIADPESFMQCPPGSVGEIWIFSPSVARGYWQRPEETERTFHAYLANTGEGPFLRTGDLGFLYDGEVFLVGRLKDLIIIRGRNLSPERIELTVQQSHSVLRPASAAAFSIDIDDEERLVIVQEIDPETQNPLEVIATIRQ